MPDTKTYCSRGTPRPASTFLSWARIDRSPHPGHHRTSWSVEKSFGVRIGSGEAMRPSTQHFVDLAFDLADQERPALGLVQPDRVDQERRPQQQSQLTRIQFR